MSQSANQYSRRRFVTVIGITGAVLVVPFTGCSSSTKKHATKKKAQHGKHPKGPKTMGNLLVDSYIADLKKGPAEKQIDAAKELGNMGASAKQAIPALESLLKDGDAKVRAAAQQAITSIRK